MVSGVDVTLRRRRARGEGHVPFGAAASTVLSDDVLDQIDEIVPPGLTLNPADNGWVSPALQACARRR